MDVEHNCVPHRWKPPTPPPILDFYGGVNLESRQSWNEELSFTTTPLEDLKPIPKMGFAYTPM